MEGRSLCVIFPLCKGQVQYIKEAFSFTQFGERNGGACV